MRTVDEMKSAKGLLMSSVDHLYVEKNEARKAFDSELALLESLSKKRDKLLAQIEECKKRRTEAGDRYERACVAVDEHESKNKF